MDYKTNRLLVIRAGNSEFHSTIFRLTIQHQFKVISFRTFLFRLILFNYASKLIWSISKSIPKRNMALNSLAITNDSVGEVPERPNQLQSKKNRLVDGSNLLADKLFQFIPLMMKGSSQIE